LVGGLAQAKAKTISKTVFPRVGVAWEPRSMWLTCHSHGARPEELALPRTSSSSWRGELWSGLPAGARGGAAHVVVGVRACGRCRPSTTLSAAVRAHQLATDHTASPRALAPHCFFFHTLTIGLSNGEIRPLRIGSGQLHADRAWLLNPSHR
jgi:hypothetical protein